MGFQRKQYKLMWPEGHELHGLEVTVGGMSVDELGTLSGMRDRAEGAKSFEQVDEMLKIFAHHLRSWNYEDDGVPIETTVEAIKAKADFREVLQVMLSWMEEVSDVPRPLAKSSTSGERFQVELPPMEVLSPNLQSSTGPSSS